MGIANMARAQGRREARRARQAIQQARQQAVEAGNASEQQLETVRAAASELLAAGPSDQGEEQATGNGEDQVMEEEVETQNEDDNEWEDIEEEVVLEDEES